MKKIILLFILSCEYGLFLLCSSAFANRCEECLKIYPDSQPCPIHLKSTDSDSASAKPSTPVSEPCTAPSFSCLTPKDTWLRFSNYIAVARGKNLHFLIPPHLNQALQTLFDQEQSYGTAFSTQWKKSYLQDRNPLPYASNYTLVINLDNLPDNKFYEKLGHLILKLLPSDEIPASSHPYCPEQIGHLYNTRRPGKEEDCVIDTKHSDYVAVVTDTGIYKLKFTQSERFSASTIGKYLEALTPCSKQVLPSVTHQTRPVAAKLRYQLCANDDNNKQCIDILDHALFVVILDPPLAERNESILFETMQLGEGKNRWFDKSLQVIAIGDDYIGLNVAHSHFDGMALVRKLSQKAQAPDSTTFRKPIPEEPWSFSDTSITLGHSGNTLASQARKCAFLQASFKKQELETLSKALKNKRVKTFSLDAIFQVALVAAQMQVFGDRYPLNTYESVEMSRYHHGRTECARSVTAEAIAYASRPNKETLVAALIAHKKQVGELQTNNGFERTLFMAQARMNQLTQSQDFQEVFDCLDWISKSPISTSNLGHPMFKHFVFCPTTKDGFGIGYSAPGVSDTLHFTLTCFSEQETEAEQLKDQLKKQLEDLLTLLGSDVEELSRRFNSQ